MYRAMLQPFLNAIGRELGYASCPGCGLTMWPVGRGGDFDDTFHTLWYERGRGVTLACHSCWDAADRGCRLGFVDRLMGVWELAGCADPAKEAAIRAAVAVAP